MAWRRTSTPSTRHDVPYAIDATSSPRRFGTDDPSSYPTFLPQGGIGGTGPLPEDELFGVMPWEREAFAKVTISPKQLDEAFMGGCQSILDAKLEGRDYIAGDFSTADCVLLPFLYRIRKELDIPADASRLRGYLDRAFAHPSFRRTVAEPYWWWW